MGEGKKGGWTVMMHTLRRWIVRVNSVFNRNRREQDLADEIRANIAFHIEDNVRAGMSPEEARRAALVKFGSIDNAKEMVREKWGIPFLETLASDSRYALRMIAQNPGWSSIAILSLALGIGATTAIYSFMDSILIRSLPVSHPESLVVMKWRTPKFFTSASSKGMAWSTDGSHEDEKGYLGTVFPYPALKFFTDQTDVLSSAFCYFSVSRLSVSVGDETEAINGQYVSGNYFTGIGEPPAAGRVFVDEDDTDAAAGVAILGYRFSVNHFGSAARAVDQTIRINNQPFQVVGVAEPEFFGAEPGAIPDIYVPVHASRLIQPGTYMTSMFLDPNFYWIEIMGSLKPGVSMAQAQAVLAPQFSQFVFGTTSTEKQRSNLPMLTMEQGGAGLDSLRRKYADPVYVLMTMVGLMLLIACANIANLLLARAVSRRQEIAVRLSIGASHGRIIRQLLTESVLLSCIGGVLGIGVASWGIRVLTLLLSNGKLNFSLHAELNWHVLALTLVLSVLTGLLFGLAPAVQATRVDVAPSLKEIGGRSARANRISSRFALSHFLIVAQIVFSLLLLVGAGLFDRTLTKLHSISLGFSRENILLFRINPQAAGQPATAFNTIYTNLQNRLREINGVRSVSYGGGPFPSGGGSMAAMMITGGTTPPGALLPGERVPPGPGRPPNMAAVFSVGPSFFETIQMPRLAGRDFTDRDTEGTPKVAVVNERLAKAFGLTDPVGHMLVLGKDTYEIVGMVRDALAFNLKEDYRPVVYFSYLQTAPAGSTFFEVRTTGDPLKYAATARQMVRDIDSKIAMSDVKTQAAYIDESISTEITLARMCTVFSALALAIACVGLYGTVAFNVARYTKEIGIRMTLGARATQVLWMVLREVVVLAAVGLAIGLPLVLAGSHYVRSMLYEIEPNDPLAITLAITMLLISGLVAACVPARRAARIDPMVAIRHD